MLSKIHITKEEEESKEVGRKDEGGWGRGKTNCVTNKIKRKEKVKTRKSLRRRFRRRRLT